MVDIVSYKTWLLVHLERVEQDGCKHDDLSFDNDNAPILGVCYYAQGGTENSAAAHALPTPPVPVSSMGTAPGGGEGLRYYRTYFFRKRWWKSLRMVSLMNLTGGGGGAGGIRKCSLVV